jgi:uncharacterized protein YeaO (DUF488 family)
LRDGSLAVRDLLTVGNVPGLNRPVWADVFPVGLRHPGGVLRTETARFASRRCRAGFWRRMVTDRPQVRMRRIYDDPAADDGIRVLVDRRWPRGVSKAQANVDEWCTAVAPSDDLRKWYGHSADRFEEFETRYREELQEPKQAAALRHLRVMCSHDRLTLLTATRRIHLSQAAILVELLRS